MKNKYRGWNYKEKKYDEPFKNCSTTYNLDYYENTKHVEYPELFTGLKDINKKDIYYKTDIVEFEVYEDNKGFISPAASMNLKGTFCFSGEELRAEIDILPEFEEYGYICLSYNPKTMRNFKIIGNTHDEDEK